jgi:hypothetical protein
VLITFGTFVVNANPQVSYSRQLLESSYISKEKYSITLKVLVIHIEPIIVFHTVTICM